jgi:hypothetical protein
LGVPFQVTEYGAIKRQNYDFISLILPAKMIIAIAEKCSSSEDYWNFS